MKNNTKCICKSERKKGGHRGDLWLIESGQSGQYSVKKIKKTLVYNPNIPMSYMYHFYAIFHLYVLKMTFFKYKQDERVLENL